MKKSKKALLWTIVPVLGVSSGVAGAVAGVTNQKTSVDTNNVATPATATTMTTRSSRSTSNLKISVQPLDTLTFSGSSTSMNAYVSGTTSANRLKYVWKVNKGDGKGWQLHTSGGIGHTGIDAPKTSELVDWTFRCEIHDEKSSWKAVTREAKLTIAPWLGRYVRVTEQPKASQVVSDGDVVTLTTKAEAISTYSGKSIGYQWFEYDSENNKLTKIDGANKSVYTFTAEYSEQYKTKKYVCRYYFEDNSDVYLSESNQSVITIGKGEAEKITIDSLTASSEAIEADGSVTLSVEAKSTKTENLQYKWYKSYGEELEFKEIVGSESATYTYKATSEDAGKTLFFSVMVRGTKQYGKQNYLQSGNLKVTVSSSDTTSESATNETFANKLSITSSVVTTNQASVRSTFYPVPGIKTPSYKVDVQGATTELTYKWYYVGQGKKEYLIQDSTSNVLTTSKDLYQKVYNDNINHKVGIVCRIYNGDQLVGTVDQTTNKSFYMTVVVTRR